MKLKRFLLIVFILLFLNNYSALFSFPIYKTKLKNGLTIVLSEDHSLPIVSVLVAYKAGSINDPPGKWGVMYLLQNMMFQGSENIDSMEHLLYVNQAGGELNALIFEDRTFFYQTLPSNYLSLVLWLESDRMISLRFSSYGFEELKERVIEDIKYKVENQPYLSTYFRFDQLAFPNLTYSHPVIGTEESIKTISLEDVKKCYYSYYAPNNAVLVIVGDFNFKKTIYLIKKYFGSIPKREIKYTSLPTFSHQKEIVEIYKDAFIPLPVIHLGYSIPKYIPSDYYPLVLLEYILLKGKSSRLINRLIEKERLVFQINGGIEKKGKILLFKIFAVNNNILTMDRTLNIIVSEIDKLKKRYISERELQRAKNKFKSDYYRKFSSTLEKAIFLANQIIDQKSVKSIEEEFKNYMKVTALDLMRVVNRYFLSKNRIVLKVIPK